MVKHLLSLAAVAAMALNASAEVLELDLNEPLTQNWGGDSNSYNNETHTITFGSGWSGMGWDFWSDYSPWSSFTIEFEPTNFTVQLFVSYIDDVVDHHTASVAPGSTSCSIILNPAATDQLGQIVIQNSAAGELTLTKAYFESSEGEGGLLWKGEYEATGWAAGAHVATALVNEGDILHYTMTPGADNSQVLVKNESWQNLLGSSKIQNNSIINDVVEVVVTKQMIENAGANFFFQGDGGMGCTKVEKVGEMTFDKYEAINYGVRNFPIDVYTTIPDEATELIIVFDEKPTWLQVCNSGWTELLNLDAATVVEESEESITLSFALTEEIKEDINKSKEIILNGEGALYYGMSLNNPSSGIKAVEAAEANAPVVYYNLQGMKVLNPSNGIFIKRQGNKAVKVVM